MAYTFLMQSRHNIEILNLSDAVQGPMTETGARVWEEMVEIGEHCRMPIVHSRDLYVHDRHALMDIAPEAVFAWGLRDNCTVIVWSSHANTVADADDTIDGAMWFAYRSGQFNQTSVKGADRVLSNARDYQTVVDYQNQRRAERGGRI